VQMCSCDMISWGHSKKYPHLTHIYTLVCTWIYKCLSTHSLIVSMGNEPIIHIRKSRILKSEIEN